MKENIKESDDEEDSSECNKCYSLNSDSINEIKEEKTKDNLEKKINEVSLDFSKKESLSSLNLSNIDTKPNNDPNDNNKNLNNLNDIVIKSKTDFIIRRYSSSDENKRYDNMNEIYNDNFKFLSFVKDDYDDEDDIVNNAITPRYNTEESNEKNYDEINKLDSDDLKSENINIYSNTGGNKLIDSTNDKNQNDIKIISNNKLNNFEKINEKEVIIHPEKIINEIKEEKNKIINNIESNNNNNKKNKELVGNNPNQNINNSDEMNKQRTIKFLNMKKQKKIFHKFLSVSVDTSGLYSLDDDMKILILNPTINYNYPFNKKERELE